MFKELKEHMRIPCEQIQSINKEIKIINKKLNRNPIVENQNENFSKKD